MNDLKNKTLILIGNNPKHDIFYYDWLDRGYNANVIVKDVSKILKPFRKICLENKTPLFRLWMNDVYKDLNKFETIILHMTRYTKHLPHYISKDYPDLRIICWYWNTVDSYNYAGKLDNPKIEYWSFDKNDCEKYGFKYNTQYYCRPNITSDYKDSDVYFVGLSKNRDDIISSFVDIASKQNISCNINIIKNYSHYIDYKDIQESIAKAKAVLEINKENQIGLTLRALESLFFEVKLITNNPMIKKHPIYNKNNIFIIGEDDCSNLSDFIQSPYDNSVNVFKKDYELDNWFNNFFN